MSIYFTSDLHIGHNKDFLWKARGFSSIEQHDTAILNNWNRVVEDEDTVYILGDLFLGGNKTEFNRIFSQLKGHKILIRGNHDTTNKIKMYVEEYNIEDKGYADIFIYKKHRFYLSHYPTFTANYDDNKRQPLINLFGHTHQKINFFDVNNPYMYHVGVDSHLFTPVSIDEIIEDINNKRSLDNEIKRQFFQ